MSMLQPGGKSLFAVVKEAAGEWVEDNVLRLSAALSYYSIFSIAPLLVIVMAITGWVLGEEAARGILDQQLKSFVGAQTAEGIGSMVRSASEPASSFWAGVIGTLTLLFGATGVFGQLKDALNTIWEVKPKPGQGVMTFVRERILSFGMVLVIGFLLLVSLMLTTALSAVSKYVGSALPFGGVLIGTLGVAVSFAVVTVLFAAIFKFLPDAKVEWRHVWIGAIATALLFEVGKFLLGFYLGRESTASAYGAAASAVLVLLWVYYASLILFFGAEFTQVYARADGARIEPAANAVPVTAEARAQQGIPKDEPVDPHAELDPAQAWSGPPPLKEHLHVALNIAPETRELSPEMQKVHDVVQRHPVPSLLGMVGLGWGLGKILRALNAAPPELTPAQQVKEGTRGLALAGLAATTAFLSRAMNKTRAALEPDELRAKGQQIRKKAHDVVEGIADRLA